MKKYKFLFLLTLLSLFAVSTFAQKAKTIDTFGYYTIVKPTKEFADISEVHLSGNYGAEQNPPIYGLIRLKNKNAKDFHLLKPSMNGRNISFITKSVGAINYTFVGRFTKLYDKVLEAVPGTPPSGIVLEGKLTKLKGKTKIAEQQVKFTHFAGD